MPQNSIPFLSLPVRTMSSPSATTSEKPHHPFSASPSPSSRTIPHEDTKPDVLGYKCLWIDCGQDFLDPETLYNHLCNDHIGRKSTNNLCLTCKWKDCGTTCAKRDHITSHLRGSYLFIQVPPALCLIPPYLSPHPTQASRLRSASHDPTYITAFRLSLSLDLQKILQATPGPEEARKDSHRGTSYTTQAFKSYYRCRPRLCAESTRRLGSSDFGQ